jgi:hypothetical protein
VKLLVLDRLLIRRLQLLCTSFNGTCGRAAERQDQVTEIAKQPSLFHFEQALAYNQFPIVGWLKATL